MARLTVPDAGRTTTDPAEIAAFMAPFGIHYERWPARHDVGEDASNEEILAAYAPEIEKLKAAGGYVTADVINITPATPNLDAMLAKFDKEHIHTEDEVRFVVKGKGTFHIHPRLADGSNGPVFAVEMEPGDLINVPHHTRHWFDLCTDRTIRAIRLFQDTTGWTPHYETESVHVRYAPVCWGPAYLERHGLREGVEPLAAPTVAGVRLNSTPTVSS